MSNKISNVVKPGVVTGRDVQKVFAIAKANNFALPAVNVVGTNSVNAVIEAAKMVNAPVMIQFSNGGAAFYAGKGLSNENQKAAIAGAISGAKHVHYMAEEYGVPVIAGGGVYDPDQVDAFLEVGAIGVQLDAVLWSLGWSGKGDKE